MLSLSPLKHFNSPVCLQYYSRVTHDSLTPEPQFERIPPNFTNSKTNFDFPERKGSFPLSYYKEREREYPKMSENLQDVELVNEVPTTFKPAPLKGLSAKSVATAKGSSHSIPIEKFDDNGSYASTVVLSPRDYIEDFILPPHGLRLQQGEVYLYNIGENSLSQWRQSPYNISSHRSLDGVAAFLVKSQEQVVQPKSLEMSEVSLDQASMGGTALIPFLLGSISFGIDFVFIGF